MRQDPVSLEEVLACSMSKSFDYRVLNFLLYRVAGKPYDEQALAFLLVDEHLVDINDDLVDYEKDVTRNSFNIYRGYVHCFGPDEGSLQLVKRISAFEEDLEAKLATLSEERRAAYIARRSGAMELPGSEKWIFPCAITDEAKFRSRTANAGDDGDRS